MVEAYAKANKLWGDASDPDYVEPQYSEYEELDLGTVVPSIAGPKRPQDRILLSEAKEMFEKTAPAYETEKTVKDPVAVSTISAAISTSKTATWPSPRSPHAPTPPTRP